jgi:putative copper export protein
VASLATTLYGQLLLVKVVLLAIMLALAGLNERRVRSSKPLALGQPGSFGGGIGVELTLGLVVFAIAALLSGTPPNPTG